MVGGLWLINLHVAIVLVRWVLGHQDVHFVPLYVARVFTGKGGGGGGKKTGGWFVTINFVSSSPVSIYC